jgi:hypothetical protein
MDQRTARQLAFAAAALALLALLLAPNAHANEPTRLDDAAVLFSQRHPTILCPSTLDWDEDPLVLSQAAPEHVLGYTRMFRDEIVLSPDVCEGARGAADSRLRPEERAVGILVLVHEALHVRRWKNRWVEAKVECLAIRDFTLGAVLLGATPEEASALLPYALAAHRQMGELSPQYADPACRLP